MLTTMISPPSVSGVYEAVLMAAASMPNRGSISKNSSEIAFSDDIFGEHLDQVDAVDKEDAVDKKDAVDKEVARRYIMNLNHKYMRVLGAFYMRLTGSDVDVHKYLEPLYHDCRKLRVKFADGSGFALTRVGDFVQRLVRDDLSCGITLPRIRDRSTLESLGLLEPTSAPLDYSCLCSFEEEDDCDSSSSSLLPEPSDGKRPWDSDSDC